MIRSRTVFAVLLMMASAVAATAFANNNPPPIDTVPGKYFPPSVLVRKFKCEELTKLNPSLPGGQILEAFVVPAGNYTVPGTTQTFTGLPKFCRVRGNATPTGDSLISYEVWIPYDGSYNTKYLQIGNGGFAGDIVYGGLAEGIRRGYATASTDDGSQAHGAATFVLGHPQTVIDYGWRALKETTIRAKAIIRGLMGAFPVHSYFHGCSDGGREALMEAQRYPTDFDGIVVGAPANNFTHQFAAFVYNAKKMYPQVPPPPPPTLPTTNLPSSLLGILSAGVQAQCAGHDGGLSTDHFLTNPPACHVNFTPFTCSATLTSNCLTLAQVEVVKAIYEGTFRDDGSNTRIYAGFEPGNESDICNWKMWLTTKDTGEALCGPEFIPPHVSMQALFGWGFFGFFVHGNPSFDIHSVNFSSDIDDVDNHVVPALGASFGDTLNSTNPDLHLFFEHGGKLIQYHGWDDSAVAPGNSISYWASVESNLKTIEAGFTHTTFDDFYRLFMVPGMSHCAGGPGATAFGNVFRGSALDPEHDVMRALEHWVEDHVAPAHIIAKHWPVPGDPANFERPICPYPQLPHFDHIGPETAASSWSCRVPPRFPVPHYPPTKLTK